METINTTRRELQNLIRKELKPIYEMFEVSDIVNREEAIKILNISSRAFSNYIGDGRIRVASKNAAGAKFFSRQELLGLKKPNNKKNEKTDSENI
jgi:hypothetical protein